MPNRIIGLLALVLAVALTAWLLRALDAAGRHGATSDYHDPDYYMEDFTTVTIEADGFVKNKLSAVYMAHYPDGDITELLKPRMEIFRKQATPVYIIADKGWVTSDNEVILLRGAVRLWEEEESGKRSLQVDTSEARVLVNDEYAETDKPAVIKSKSSVISGAGMRAYFNESRLEVMDHEKTTILQEPGS